MARYKRPLMLESNTTIKFERMGIGMKQIILEWINQALIWAAQVNWKEVSDYILNVIVGTVSIIEPIRLLKKNGDGDQHSHPGSRPLKRGRKRKSPYRSKQKSNK